LLIANGFLSHEQYTISHPTINKTRPRLMTTRISVVIEFNTGVREKLSRFAYRVDFHPRRMRFINKVDAESRTDYSMRGLVIKPLVYNIRCTENTILSIK